MADDKLYQEELMDHFRYPRNKKKIENPDFSSGQQNPSCGDTVFVEGKVAKDEKGVMRVVDIGFGGSGCVISQAAASMLTEKCIGKTVDEVLSINKDDILGMVKLKLGPLRMHCALLCLEALKDALRKFTKEVSK